MHPQKMKAAIALQRVTQAGIKCPGGPGARLLSVASWDKELLFQHSMGALELERPWQLQRETWRLRASL